MKQINFFLISLLVLAICNTKAASDPISDYIQGATLKSGSSESTNVVLNPPTYLKGGNLHISGQSESPSSIRFTWADNSTGEDGYKFQRRYAGIYWNIGCEAPANSTSKIHNLSFQPKKTENFRAFSYKGSERSEYATASIEMLRPDYIPAYYYLGSTSVLPGESLYIRSEVENIGTYAGTNGDIKFYLSTNATFESTDKLIHRQAIEDIPANGSSSSNYSYHFKTDRSMDNQDWYIIISVNNGWCYDSYSGCNYENELTKSNNNVALKFRVTTGSGTDPDPDSDLDPSTGPIYEITKFEKSSDSYAPFVYPAISVKNTGDAEGTPDIKIGFIQDLDYFDEVNEFINNGNSFSPSDFHTEDYTLEYPICGGCEEDFSREQIYSIYTNEYIYVVAYIENSDETYTRKYYRMYMQSGKKSATADVVEESEESFSVYPNPGNGFYSVNLKDSEYTSLEVFDFTGRVIYTQNLINQTGIVELDLSSFENGQYILKINSLNETQSKLLIKQ